MRAMTKRQADPLPRNAAAHASAQKRGRPNWGCAFLRVMRVYDGTTGISDVNGRAFLAGFDT